ncbi:flagellar FlbD family protein [Sinomonas halotolerans]|uniref:Flagellar FlbD family protein n=1 Tax=Sinomonas halotolerans TaxID=1644133 RepID=A0ABU9WYS0_9MICC
MIVVTRLNGSQFALNPDLLERVQATPDTTLFMVGGASYVVQESVGEVIEAVARARAHVLALASELRTPGPDRTHLRAVSPLTEENT